MDWFTADTHAYHDKIISACGRPYDTGGQMTVALADTINEYVESTDTLFHLGDFCWKGKAYWAKFRAMINCRQIFLIRGNHDNIGLNDTHKWFASIFDIYERDNIIMCHRPFETWDKMHHGSIHLHGHCHGMLGDNLFKLRTDVGVDAQGKPISRDDVEDIMHMRISIRKALLGHRKASERSVPDLGAFVV